VKALRKHIDPERILVALAGDFESKKGSAKAEAAPAEGKK